MAEPAANLGVSESSGTYNDSLRQIGKQDKSGETIGISMTTANFTADYGSIAISKQFVMQIHTPHKFVSSTNPAAMMKIQGLKTGFEIRKAALKRRIWEKLVPPEISVFTIEGVGPGLGMSIGNEMFAKLAMPKGIAEAADPKPEE